MVEMVYIFIGVFIVIFSYGIFLYNRLVMLKNVATNSFSQIDVQLKRRYDLIPNLVETAKGYLKHERETLEAVIQARNVASAAIQKLGSQPPSGGQSLSQLFGAEQGLSQALSRLMVVAESYPELKANQTMQQLMEELTSTENRISFARQAYNDAVMVFNTRIESFPDVFVARNAGFRTFSLYDIPAGQENQREAPAVRFGAA